MFIILFKGREFYIKSLRKEGGEGGEGERKRRERQRENTPGQHEEAGNPA